MSLVMKGVKVLEVAQFTFVPVAGAILADWGAEVIKVEHPTRGDTQRQFTNIDRIVINPERNIMMEHPNRGKRSIGIDLTKTEGQQLIYALAKHCDVFLTNYLPAQRRKFNIEVEDIRAHNPDIIYARGTAHGDKGAEREKGGFDSTTYWARGGSAVTVTPKELEGPLLQPGGAYGDTIGGTHIAAGVSAALFHRERTGEAVELDVSLLSAGVWATALTISMAIENKAVTYFNPMPGVEKNNNPFLNYYETSDGKYLNLTILALDRHAASAFETLGIGELAKDPRFANEQAILEHGEDAHKQVAAAIAQHPLAYWKQQLADVEWQWAVYQDPLDVAEDKQVLDNDLLFEVEATDDGRPITLVASPVQFDHQKIETSRAPKIAEHTAEILREAGLDEARIIELRHAKVIG